MLRYFLLSSALLFLPLMAKSQEKKGNAPEEKRSIDFSFRSISARCLCMLYGNDMSDMTTLEYASTGQTVYGYVKDCLAGCFAADPEFRKVAVLDGDINEYALKEVLGVFVL